MPSVTIAWLQLIAGAVLLATGPMAIKATRLTALALAGWAALMLVIFLTLAVRPAWRLFDRRLLPATIAHGATTVLLMLAK